MKLIRENNQTTKQATTTPSAQFIEVLKEFNRGVQQRTEIASSDLESLKGIENQFFANRISHPGPAAPQFRQKETARAFPRRPFVRCQAENPRVWIARWD